MGDSKVRGEERKGEREKIRDWWHIERQIIFPFIGCGNLLTHSSMQSLYV